MLEPAAPRLAAPAAFEAGSSERYTGHVAERFQPANAGGVACTGGWRRSSVATSCRGISPATPVVGGSLAPEYRRDLI
jgi:hypothetical protein